MEQESDIVSCIDSNLVPMNVTHTVEFDRGLAWVRTNESESRHPATGELRRNSLELDSPVNKRVLLALSNNARLLVSLGRDKVNGVGSRTQYHGAAI